MEEGRRALRFQDRAHRRLRQFLGDGRYRPMRPLLGDLLRSRGGDPGRAAGLARCRRRPLHRDLEPRLHAVRAGLGGRAPLFAAPLDRHRHGARTHRRRAAGRARQLRHRPLPHADRRHPRSRRPPLQCGEPGEPARHRRSSARHEFSDRRRRAPFQRRPRLRASAHHAPRHAPRASARRERAGDLQARARCWCARWATPIRSSGAPKA